MPTIGHSGGTSTKSSPPWYSGTSKEYQRVPTFGSLYSDGLGVTLFSSGGIPQGLTEGGHHGPRERSPTATGHSASRRRAGRSSAAMLRAGYAHAAAASRASQRRECGLSGGVGMPHLRPARSVANPGCLQFLPCSSGCPARPSPPQCSVVRSSLRSSVWR